MKKRKLVMGTTLALALAVGSTSTIFASDGFAVTSKAENTSVHRLVIPTGLSNEEYRLDVKVFKLGNVITEINDQTGELTGYFGPLWEQFKGENGLAKYNGLTFEEIKSMETPKPIVTMAGSMDMPEKIHRELLQLIDTLEKTQEGEVQKQKAELAKVFHSYTAYYQNDDYTEETLRQFNLAYEKAEEILSSPTSTEAGLKEALTNLVNAKENLKTKTMDYSSLKAKIEEGDRIVEKSEEYDLIPLLNLKEVLLKAKTIVEKGATSSNELKEAEEQLSKAIQGATKRAKNSKVYYINGTTGTMADDFMSPVIHLEEKDGKAIYTFSFKEDNGNGLKSRMEYLKHVQGGKEVMAKELPGNGEFTQLFQITRDTLQESEFEIILNPIVMKREVRTKIKLDLSTKREEGAKTEKVDKSELEALIRSEQETYDDVNAGIYKPLGSKEYLNKYAAALEALKDENATKESVEQVVTRLKNSKSRDLVLTNEFIAPFKEEITVAETKLAETEKYTEASLGNLKKAVEEAKDKWKWKSRFTKETFTQARENLKIAVEALDEIKAPTEGTQTPEPEKKEEGTQTPEAEKKEEGTQTPEPEKKEEGTQTPEAEKKEEGTQTPEPEKKEEGTQTPEAEKKEEGTQTPEAEKKEEGTQTQEPEKKEEGTQTPEPEKKEEGTQTPNPEKKEEEKKPVAAKAADTTKTSVAVKAAKTADTTKTGMFATIFGSAIAGMGMIIFRRRKNTH